MPSASVHGVSFSSVFNMPGAVVLVPSTSLGSILNGKRKTHRVDA